MAANGDGSPFVFLDARALCASTDELPLLLPYQELRRRHPEWLIVETITLEQACLRTSWLSDAELQCVVPPGVGESLHVRVQVRSKGSVNPVNYMFSYQPPVLEGLSLNESHTVGNETLTVRGRNFGPAWAAAAVTVGGVPCLRQTRVSHREIRCLTPPGVGVRKRVVVQHMPTRMCMYV